MTEPTPHHPVQPPPARPLAPLRRARAAVGGVLVATVVGALALTGTGHAPGVLRTLGLVSAASPANDTFANATRVVGDTFAGSTVGAGTEPAEVASGEAQAGDRTVWFSWTPAQSGFAYLLPDPGASPQVRVFTGSVLGQMHQVDVPASQPGSGAAAPGGADATTVPAVGGATYALQVSSPPSGGTPFGFTLTQPAPGAPANDDVGQAEPLGPALAALAGGGHGPATEGTTAGATTEAGEPAQGGVAAAHSVWYSVPAGAAPFTLTVAPLGGVAGGDGLRLAAWSGASVADLVPLGTDAGGTLRVQPSATAPVLVSVSGPESYFTLSAAVAAAPPADSQAPTVDCRPPAGWTTTGLVPCSAADGSSGLADPADAQFSLLASVPAGTATRDGSTPTRTVCDKAGNCTTVGPFTVSVDRSAPTVVCPPTPAAWSATDVALDCTSADDGSGLAAPADAAFTLRTAVPPGATTGAAAFGPHPPVCDRAGNCTAVPVPAPAKVDTAPPTVTCGPPPAGWLDHEATVTCTASDLGAGLAAAADATVTVSTSVGDTHSSASAATASRQVCDQVGNCTPVGPFSGLEVDRAAPVLTCLPPAGPTAGTTASVRCTARDDASGLASAADATFDLDASIPAGAQATESTSTRKVCDVAGNCTTAGPFAVALDDAPPVITCSQPPSGWVGGAVRVGCAASDAGSGLLHPADATFDLVADVAPGSASASVLLPSRTVCDAVANCATTPALGTVQIDRAAPVATCDPVPSGVSPIEVALTCHAGDAASGLADPSQATFELRTSVGAGHRDLRARTSSVQVCDAVGNCATAGAYSVQVDRTLPPPAGPPHLDAPRQVGVLLAGTDPQARFDLPFALPAAVGGAGRLDEGCDPRPGAPFRLGLTLVTCGVSDRADQDGAASFYVTAAAAPELAPSGPAPQGQAWRAVGGAFAPGSAVTVTLDGATLDRTRADGAGRLDDVVTIPAATPLGAATLVARGTDANGSPLYVVTPLVIRAAGSQDVRPPTPTPTSASVPSATGASVAPPAAGAPAPAGANGGAPTTTGARADRSPPAASAAASGEHAPAAYGGATAPATAQPSPASPPPPPATVPAPPAAPVAPVPALPSHRSAPPLAPAPVGLGWRWLLVGALVVAAGGLVATWARRHTRVG